MISKDLFKTIRNTVVSNTGNKVTDKDISLIIYLYEKEKKKPVLVGVYCSMEFGGHEIQMKINNYCNYFLPFSFNTEISNLHNEAVRVTRLEF